MGKEAESWRSYTFSAENGAQNETLEQRRNEEKCLIFFSVLLNSFGFLLFVLFVSFSHLGVGGKTFPFVCASVSSREHWV